MKVFSGFLLCLYAQVSLAQWPDLATMQFREDAVYLMTRGSSSKTRFIADDFNAKDRYSTHVGLGIYREGRLLVYHVSNEERAQDTALYVDDWTVFYDGPDVYYASVWECVLNTDVMQKLKFVLRQSQSKPITFDMDFNPEDDARQYCSEFCVKTLHAAAPEVFAYTPVVKTLSGFYQMALQREELLYWPVDFFTGNGLFLKCLEVNRL